MSWNSFREKVNLLLIGHKARTFNSLRLISFLVSALAIGSIVSYHGFAHTSETIKWHTDIIKFSFAFYILRYLIRVLYDFHPLEFMRKNWLEGIAMLFLFIEGISDLAFDTLLVERFFHNMGFESFGYFSNLFIQFYLLFVVGVELTKESGFLPKMKLNPATLFILSFMLIIGAGTGLLMLPQMTTIPGSMGFLDALFTSTSATCVTGLLVVDTATFFTFKGQFIIMILVQLGGLNIIAFGAFLAFVSKFGVGVKQHDVIEDFVHAGTLTGADGLLSKIISWCFAIELIGAVMMYVFWNPAIEFANAGEKIFFSVFHSISAFNNAGLSLFTDGLNHPMLRDNYLIHLSVTLLVFFGALGFVSILDMFGTKNLRQRLNQPWRRISFSTKISLYFSLILVGIGVLTFWIFEYNNNLEDLPVFPQFVHSLLQSCSRTSGFNTVDIGSLSMPMLIMFLFLMFVGSSSSSTGGGIKTSTFAVIYASVVSTIKGKKNVELFKRSINQDLVNRAFSVLVFYIVGNIIAIFALSITESAILAMENRSIMDLIFEVVSGMGTVGLSTGITSLLSDSGRIVIILSMFVGRVGTLTVAYAVGKSLISKNYKYPYGHTMIG